MTVVAHRRRSYVGANAYQETKADFREFNEAKTSVKNDSNDSLYNYAQNSAYTEDGQYLTQEEYAKPVYEQRQASNNFYEAKDEYSRESEYSTDGYETKNSFAKEDAKRINRLKNIQRSDDYTFDKRYHAKNSTTGSSHTHDINGFANSINAKVRRETQIRRFKSIVLAVLVVFVLLFGIGLITFKSMITSAQIEINHINQQIWNLDKENSMLKGRIVSASNIEMIKEHASDLGMSQPSPDQVKYISVMDMEVATTSTLAAEGESFVGTTKSQ